MRLAMHLFLGIEVISRLKGQLKTGSAPIDHAEVWIGEIPNPSSLRN